VEFPVAFRTAGLDRAANRRADPGLRQLAEASTYVFWRGKLLVGGDNRPHRIALDHPALEACRDAPVFIGITESGPRFAADLTLWSPPEDAETIGQFTDATQQHHPAFPDARLAEIRGLMAGFDVTDGECIATGRALVNWHATHRFCSNCGTPSDIELSGWVRRCPQCGTQHFPRTDPVVIMAITRNDRLLLGRGAAWPEGMYSLLAGFVEPGETIEAAVRRETFEEAAIRVGRVGYIASQPWPFPMSLMFGCSGEALDEAITIDPAELVDARWVARDEAQQMVAGTHPTISTPRPGAIAGSIIAAWAAGRLVATDE
jgi:NAD+ diphosphatase